MHFRTVAWWATLGIGAALSIPLLIDARYNYMHWQTTTNDPSAKDAYLTFLQGDLVLLGFVVLATGVALWFLRKRPIATSPSPNI